MSYQKKVRRTVRLTKRNTGKSSYLTFEVEAKNDDEACELERRIQETLEELGFGLDVVTTKF